MHQDHDNVKSGAHVGGSAAAFLAAILGGLARHADDIGRGVLRHADDFVSLAAEKARLDKPSLGFSQLNHTAQLPAGST